MFRYLAVAALALTCLAAAPARAADAPDFIALEQQRSAAIVAHDNAFLDSLYAEDFRGITSTGFEVDKATLMKVFARDDPSTKFVLDEQTARVLGDSAVTTGRVTGRGPDGKVTLQFKFMHVYARRDGRWVLVAGAGTPLPG